MSCCPFCFVAPGSKVAKNACFLFPCDTFSTGCTLIVAQSVNKADRVCGPCRTGFSASGEACIDMRVQDLANEPVASGNVAWFVETMATTVNDRPQTAADMPNMLTAFKKAMNVRNNLITANHANSLPHPAFLLSFVSCILAVVHSS